MEPEKADVIKDLAGDLARKYQTHGAAVESCWRAFDRQQRIRCIKAGAADGVVLKHRLDRSMGNVYKIMPEWNINDLTDPQSDFLLDLLRHRATTSLVDQYSAGINDGPGDYAVIDEMIRTRGLSHVNSFPNCHTFFLEDRYGQSFKIERERASVLASFEPAIRAGWCIPQSTGELVLERQLYLLQAMNIVIEDILEEGSSTRARKQQPKKSDKETASAALTKLSIREPPKVLSLPDLVLNAVEQKESLEDHLGLLTTEPVVLAHDVNIWFFSRPELVVDEKGRSLPVHTDKYISAALFETLYHAVKGAATWNYLSRLLELLQASTVDKAYRVIILQEISNVCHQEFERTRAIFKRQVQTDSGFKWFKRISGAQDKAGNARVALKGDPEVLNRVDPQLHYMLRLCDPSVNATKAVEWMKKLGDLYSAHPEELEKLGERESDALCDMAIVVYFIQDLAPVISMPSLSRKQGQMFSARSQDLDAEMNKLKTQLDLRDFVVPIDNLLEPGVASDALKALDHFVVENQGTQMGFLYQDLIGDCLFDLEARYQHVKTKQEQKSQADWKPLPAPVSQPQEKIVEQRRQKEKTRPPHPSDYSITPREETPATTAQPEHIFQVKASTAETFSTLFSREDARGSITWTAFASALGDLGFSVLPRFGSVYTFSPPEDVGMNRAVTVHRPHGSRIEGHLLLVFARKLQRLYGWSEKSFEVA
ncbi:hypothetical protein H2200_004904 [Cladophialophora chaetospira]|uniref:Ipa protein n=1 Tax=Cladophialophora chaetospira TaxID=386627 RepID=A0AA39CKL4_9EURO|nr:hypothetical protein H2200_004904 [Cladophialophora chaetospira]